ncbi:hypothetical protein ACOSOMT5_P3058 [Acidiphilium sp. MT5]
MTAIALTPAPAVTSTARPVKHFRTDAKIAFSRPQTIVDRDFDLSHRIKYVGTLAATAVTLITGAVFLFM